VKPTILNEVELERFVTGLDVPAVEPGIADPADAPRQAAPTVPVDVPQIMIEARFVEAPESVVADLTMGIPLSSPDGGDPARRLSESKYRDLIQHLERTAGVDLLAAPRITTLSGRQAQIQLVKAESLLERHGPTLDVLPRVTEDGAGFDLVILASAPGLVDTHQGLPVFRERRLTTRATIRHGETLLLGVAASPTTGAAVGAGATPGSAGQPSGLRRLVVLVTPRLVNAEGATIMKTE
jgi:hypothetical protein